MPKAKLRRFHVHLDPEIKVVIGDHHVTFIGATFHSDRVMIEYDIDPPLQTESPFGPHLLILTATDDVSHEPYGQAWYDFQWPWRSAGRTTTRLEKRPPSEATRLHVVVQPAEPDSDRFRRTTSLRPVIAEFDVPLPPDHGEPRQPDATAQAEP